MTEKDFKKRLNELELTPSLKERIEKFQNEIINIVKSNLSINVVLDKVLSLGKLESGLLLNSEIESTIIFKLNVQKLINKQYEVKLLQNELENAIIYGLDQRLVCFNSENKIKLLIKDNDLNISTNIILVFDDEEFNRNKERISLLEKINNKHTYYKNVIRLIEDYSIKENISLISYYQIALILAYSLDKYEYINKYFSYLNVFTRGIEDFVTGKKIEINTSLYDSLISNNQNEGTFLNKYQIIDPVMQLNLAASINDININEFRKLKKKLVKEIEVEEDIGFTFDNSIEVVIDVNPLFDDKNKIFLWHYNIIGKNLENAAGNYANNEEAYATAILKGTFKGLKALVDNNLIKKKIYIKCDKEDIFGQTLLVNDENKSRLKTIKALIENNNLNVILRK